MSDNKNKLEITVNGEPLVVDEGTTVTQLLARMQMNRRGIAVEINQQLEPRENHDHRIVQQGDWFEIVTLVGGG